MNDSYVDRCLHRETAVYLRVESCCISLFLVQVTNKKDNPEQEFTMLESLCELGQSPSTDGAADGGVEATAARERGSL